MLNLLNLNNCSIILYIWYICNQLSGVAGHRYDSQICFSYTYCVMLYWTCKTDSELYGCYRRFQCRSDNYEGRQLSKHIAGMP